MNCKPRDFTWEFTRQHRAACSWFLFLLRNGIWVYPKSPSYFLRGNQRNWYFSEIFRIPLVGGYTPEFINKSLKVFQTLSVVATRATPTTSHFQEFTVRLGEQLDGETTGRAIPFMGSWLHLATKIGSHNIWYNFFWRNHLKDGISSKWSLPENFSVVWHEFHANWKPTHTPTGWFCVVYLSIKIIQWNLIPYLIPPSEKFRGRIVQTKKISKTLP